MTAALIAAISMAAGLVAALVWLMHALIAEKDARREATLDAAHAEAAEREAIAAAETAEQLHRAESARADALEEELAHVDQAAIDRPDSSARERVLSRWRKASRAAADNRADGASPVSQPAATDEAAADA